MALSLATERRAAALLREAVASPPPADASSPAAEAEDAQFLTRKAAVAALRRARQSDVNSRFSALVPELETRLGAAEQGGDAAAAVDEIGTDEPPQSSAQMLAKLRFVAEAGEAELRRSCEDSEEQEGDRDWARLLSIVYGPGGDGEPEKLQLWERDAEARKLDEQLDARLASGEGLQVETAVSRHLLAVVKATRHSQHSLNQLLREFSAVLSACYEPFESTNGPRSPELRASWSVRAACALPLIAADVAQFAGLVAQVLLHKHPLLRDIQTNPGEEGLLPVVRRVVLDICFDELYPVLHGTFASAFRREDTFVSDLAYWSRARPPSFFNVRPELRLDGVELTSGTDNTQQRAEGVHEGTNGEEGTVNQFEREREEWRRERNPALDAYSSAFYWLNSMPTSSRAPSEKLRRLVLACDEARDAPSRYYGHLRRADHGATRTWPGPADLDISATDLYSILAFLLTGATNISAHAFSHLALLSCFMPVLIVSGDGQQERSAVAVLESAATLLISESASNAT